MTDLDYAALTVYGEASGEPIEGRIAVACVIRNRLKTGRWGSTYESVCLSPWQFSCWRSAGGEENYRRLMALVAKVDTGGGLDDPIYAETRWMVDGLSRGVLLDRVHKATHYFTASIPEIPKWAHGKAPVARVGAHVFFEGIP